VTAQDVAALAGVSRSTVSYVLNGSARLDNFSIETVERVRAAAAELAYTPDAAARALRKGASGVVLLTLPDLPLSGSFSRQLSGLSDAVSGSGRSLPTWSIGPGVHLTQILRDISPRAILEFVPLPEDDRKAAVAAGIPIMSVTEPIDLDHTIGRLQVVHLARAGHRRLGLVTVEDPRVAVFTGPRRDGAVEAVVTLGLPLPLELRIGRRDAVAVLGFGLPLEHVRGGPDDAVVWKIAETLRAWNAGTDPVTAICCFNDMFAGLVIAAARCASLKVPEDLSVIGVDDEPLGGLLQPRLTTARYDYETATAYAGARIQATLDGKPALRPPSSDLIEVIERESVAPLHP